MQFVAIVLLLAVAVGFLARGSLRPFEQINLRWWGVAIAGLALQVVPLPQSSGRAVVTATLVASYALLITFVWVNRRLPAAPLMLIGLSLNLSGGRAERGDAGERACGAGCGRIADGGATGGTRARTSII